MPTFEERLSSLEAVVERLERGELSLDESVRLFEQGIHLSNACKQELDQAEGRIQVLVESPNGPPQLAEMDLDEADFAPDEDDGRTKKTRSSELLPTPHLPHYDKIDLLKWARSIPQDCQKGVKWEIRKLEWILEEELKSCTAAKVA